MVAFLLPLRALVCQVPFRPSFCHSMHSSAVTDDWYSGVITTDCSGHPGLHCLSASAGQHSELKQYQTSCGRRAASTKLVWQQIFLRSLQVERSSEFCKLAQVLLRHLAESVENEIAFSLMILVKSDNSHQNLLQFEAQPIHPAAAEYYNTPRRMVYCIEDKIALLDFIVINIGILVFNTAVHHTIQQQQEGLQGVLAALQPAADVDVRLS